MGRPSITPIAVLAVLCALLLSFTPLTASAQSATSSLLVKLAVGLSPVQQAQVIARNGGIEIASIPALRLHVIEVLTADLPQVLANYQADAEVVSAEENKTRQSQALPADPLYQNQWSLPKIGWDLLFGNVTPTGSAVVAVLDTGVDAHHPDLAANVMPGISILDGSSGTTDPSGHGTWVAGIVAAQTNTLEGIAGVAYTGVRIMPVTVLDANGLGQDSDIIAGVIWAADHGADVIVMAFSSPGFSQNLQDAIDYAWSKNVILVAATGNNALNTPTFPAGDRGVMGVSGTDANDILVPFSSYGPSAFIAAPATYIQTTDIGDAYTVINGTSASAAIVAGAAAFMKAVDPTLTNGIIVGRLARMADPAGTQDQTGNGRINMARALADTSTDFIQPAGAPPTGNGGPFVGPYVAAARNLRLTFAGAGTGSVTITPNTGTVDAPVSCGGTGAPAASQTVTSTCSPNITISDNGATVTFLASVGALSSFPGWSGQANLSASTCTGTTNPCSAVLNGNPSLTVTFDRIAKVTVKKFVTNDNGGTKAAGDFAMKVSGTAVPGPNASNETTFPGSATGTEVTLRAGTYTVSESGPAGYSMSSAGDCTSVTIALGQSKTCTITNDDQPATLIVKKHVINDNGGAKAAGNFAITVTGTNVQPTATFPGSEAGVTVTLDAGSYSVDEAADSTYTKSLSADCSGSIANGETKTCTITNDDKPATLVVIKHVINDNGGTKTAGNFNITVTGTNVQPSATFPGAESPGTTVTLNAGSYSVDEAADSTYTKSLSADCSGSIANGEIKTCTITNDDIAPKLVVIKHVINDNGGTATAASFTMTVTGTNPSPASFAGAESPGTTVTLNVGSYSVSETGPTGYAMTASGSCTGTVAIGETKTCTITNDDIAPKLIVIKHVINDNGGTATAAGFTMTVTGTNPSPASFAGAESPGTTVTLNAGTYSVGESGPSGYARSDSANCSGSIAIGETKMCTVTNNDLYLFSGFFSPVDNLPALNLANAGQAIPVKWAIMTLNNVVVSDPTSFVSLESYQVACATNDALTAAIEEYAAGSSGLQYVGNGNWQFVWKTPKTYAGTCRVMLLNLSDGTQHKAVFKFKQ